MSSNFIHPKPNDRANRSKHVKASSAPIPKLLVDLSLILRATDNICITHHLMSKILFNDGMPSVK